MTIEQQARDMLERMGVDDAQSFTAGDLAEIGFMLNALAGERKKRADLAPAFAEYLYRTASQVPFEHAQWANERGAALMAALTSGTHVDAWVPVTERMPTEADADVCDGYFWCIGDGWATASIHEAFGAYGDVPAAGFCHEAVGIVNGVTHWMPAIPPQPPAP